MGGFCVCVCVWSVEGMGGGGDKTVTFLYFFGTFLFWWLVVGGGRMPAGENGERKGKKKFFL